MILEIFHRRLSLALLFFRIFSIIYSHKYYFCENKNLVNKEMIHDCNLISYYISDLETAAISNHVKQNMMESYISFVVINIECITDKYNDNNWTEIKIDDNNKIHIAMQNIIMQMTRQEKQIINVLIEKFAQDIQQ